MMRGAFVELLNQESAIEHEAMAVGAPVGIGVIVEMLSKIVVRGWAGGHISISCIDTNGLSFFTYEHKDKTGQRCDKCGNHPELPKPSLLRETPRPFSKALDSSAITRMGRWTQLSASTAS